MDMFLNAPASPLLSTFFRVPGVEGAEVSLSLERATVTYDSAMATTEQV